MPTVGFRVEGLRFQPIPASAIPLALGKQLTAAANVWGRRITDRAVITSPKATGFLASQHYYAVAVDGGGNVTLVIGNSAPYAAAVHDGSKPHEIVPVRAKALRFVKGGQVIYAQRVWHPGTPRQPWLWNATTGVLRGLSSSSEQIVNVTGPGETVSAA